MAIRVLVFDDDDGIRTMLTRVLERRGCEVFAYSGHSFARNANARMGRYVPTL